MLMDECSQIILNRFKVTTLVDQSKIHRNSVKYLGYISSILAFSLPWQQDNIQLAFLETSKKTSLVPTDIVLFFKVSKIYSSDLEEKFSSFIGTFQ
ncbi:hypothetical protein DHD05_15240 [Arenibacter sp. N53]|nr:hypothetical protein [Arenibacter sp. N53]